MASIDVILEELDFAKCKASEKRVRFTILVLRETTVSTVIVPDSNG